MGRANQSSIVGKIQNTPHYQYYKFAILGLANDCGDVLSFIPKSVQVFHRRKEFLLPLSLTQRLLAEKNIYDMSIEVPLPPKFVKRDFLMMTGKHRYDDDKNLKKWAKSNSKEKRTFELSEFNSKGKEQLKDYFFNYANELLDTTSPQRFQLDLVLRSRLYNVGRGKNSTFDLRDIPQVAAFRYLFEARGIGISSWSTEVVQGGYFLSDSLSAIQRTLKENDPSIAKEILPAPLNCQSLKKKSLEALENAFAEGQLNSHPIYDDRYLSNYTGPPFRPSTKSYPSTFKVCANCHSDEENGVGPFMPFHNQKELEELLQNNKELKSKILYRLSKEARKNLDHMPPVLLLQPQEIDSIKDYLNLP